MIPTKPIQILIFDDRGFFLDLLFNRFKEEEDVRVLATAKCPEEALSLVNFNKNEIDVAILDIVQKNGNGNAGFDLAKEIKKVNSEIKIIFLTGATDERIFKKFKKSNAYGLVVKDSSFDHLIEGIHTVMSGERYLCPRGAAFEREMGRNPIKFTIKEKHILKVLAKKGSKSAVMSAMQISKPTWDTHIRHIKEKLRSHSDFMPKGKYHKVNSEKIEIGEIALWAKDQGYHNMDLGDF